MKQTVKPVRERKKKSVSVNAYIMPWFWEVTCFFGLHSNEFYSPVCKQCWYCGRINL